MRRDYFTLEVRNADASTDGTPSVHIEFTGPDDQLMNRLTDEEGEPLDAGEVDVAYRLQDPVEAEDPDGVLGVTNRLTGEFILETNADAGDVIEFVRAARAAATESGTGSGSSTGANAGAGAGAEAGTAAGDGEGDRYRIEISLEGELVATYDKGTFLVYDDEGGLLREHSLIPNNVEL